MPSRDGVMIHATMLSFQISEDCVGSSRCLNQFRTRLQHIGQWSHLSILLYHTILPDFSVRYYILSICRCSPNDDAAAPLAIGTHAYRVIAKHD
ncbi:hypothetical protein EVAR_31557_1 [Eumeta japonica]|uniref:Uncharacterized protein n=1 Tax=Eumeta variegata TaxID=151549 RepID=A0A4C1V762_EUMVA|nr:hypothetical protein EVAR_31557_1 [Eumeta japonica]